MSKQEFLAALRKGLSGLPQEDIEERIVFYSEMIDDRMEDGLTEEAAIAEMGTVEKVVSQIMSEIPITKIAKERVKQKRSMRAWEIVLLILGSPIWLALLIAVFAIAVSVYLVIWVLLIALYAGGVSLVAGGIASIVVVPMYISMGNIAGVGCMLGGGMICFAVAIFWFFVCNRATKGVLILTKKLCLRIKSCFIKKGV